MKTLITTLAIVVMFTTAVVMANDVEDVKAAEDNYYAAMNSGDARAWAQSRLSEESTRFGPGGALLEVFGSLEEQEQNRKAEFDAGLKYNLRARHRDIRVYGNTAVVTLYGVGTVGNNTQVNNRITRVWGKQGGQWKMVHAHLSPLTISTTRIEDRFVGTWRLVAFERRGPDGELRPSTNSFSNGLLIYTSTGHISQQLTRESRQKFSGRASGEEAQEALYSYLAYFGTFTVNEGQGTVTHHRQAHLIPGRVTDGIRYYRFMGNRLMLTAPPGGEEVTTTLTWERIE
ncbi:MAG: DUF3225 domain-containing protein [Acidobacteria bacterium]|nr:DUF3225 domain-containing protein [Acidobacteriota bacterium]